MNYYIKLIKVYYFLAILFITSIVVISIDYSKTKASLIIGVSNLNSVIVLDAGHGGSDGGAVGVGEILEKDINLRLTLKLKDVLDKNGFNVILTRNGDYDLSSDGSKNRKREDIHKRVDIINSSKPLLFISIHCNIYPSSKVYGSQVFYSKKQTCQTSSCNLAKCIQESLRKNLKNTNRYSKDIKNKYLLDNTIYPGVIVESGFISNYNEAKNLSDDGYLERLAKAIYDGIIVYLSSNSIKDN